MKKASFIGLVATLGVIGLAAPVLSADVLHSRWGDQAADTVTTVALSTAADAAKWTRSDRFSDLLRINEGAVNIAPDVSDTVLTTQNVRKIGYGRVETVEIVTTASGTYSSDGLRSPHVLYPGVEVLTSQTDIVKVLLSLVNGIWTPLRLLDAGSFVSYGSGDGAHYMTDGHATCLSSKGYSGCL